MKMQKSKKIFNKVTLNASQSRQHAVGYNVYCDTAACAKCYKIFMYICGGEGT